jgi:glycosyltransferase involved in cell wall biosynthesis
MGEELNQTAQLTEKQTAGKRLRIAYYCVNDPLDKRSWSGITYYLGKALQRNVGDVDFLGPVLPSKWVDKTLRAVAKAVRMLSGEEYNVKHSFLNGWDAARQLRKKMRGKQYDCIVAPAASTELAFLKTDLPVIYTSDVTFKLISRYYKWDYEKIPAFSHWEGNKIEKKALHNSDGVILSSHWAARSAIKDYGYPAERIVVRPLGANIDFVPPAGHIFDKENNKQLTLLYLAVEWERKGGAVAFEALKELHAMGVEAKLIVCGCIPPASFSHTHMQVIPFLNKNVKQDHDLFIELLSTVHFLLLPTRADCSLIVACEANSYGVPAITTDVGGVSDAVVEGINGYCLPLEAPGKAYAEKILEVYQNKELYHRLIRSSRQRYEEVLNWDKWAEDFRQLYDAIAQSKLTAKQ